MAKMVNKYDMELFTVFDQDYLYSVNSSEFIGITPLTKKLCENVNMTLEGQVPQEIYENYSEDQVKRSVHFVKEMFKKGYIPRPTFYKAMDFKYSEYILRLVPTRRCNLNCKYCFSADKTGSKDMSVDTAVKAIDYFVNRFATPKAKLQVDLSGAGEVLLRKDFIEAVNAYILKLKRGKGVNIFASLVSNGMLLTKEMSNYLKGQEILYGVSMDGDPEETELMRKGLDYDTLVQNIQDIENTDFFGIAATVSGKNYNIKAIFEKLYSYGVANAISIKPVRAKPDDFEAINENNIEEVKKAYDEFALWMLERAIGNDKKRMDTLMRGEDFFARFLKNTLHKRKVLYRCSAGFNNIAVDHEGNILLCSTGVNSRDFIIGDIEEGITPWKKQTLRTALADNIPKCSACWARYSCGGECFAQGHLVHGDFTQPYAIMCQLKQHLIKLAIYFWRNLYFNNKEMVDYLEANY